MDLDELIEQVSGDDPLSRVASAMTVKAGLDEVADDLIGHFVDAARAAGHSWSEIGAAMGVSKQAAQQRHTTERPSRERPPWRMGGRWTDRAKNAVKESSDAAAEMGYSYIGTEHLLLGLLAIPQGIAGKLLIGAGLTRDDVVARLLPADTVSSRRRRHIPLTPRAKEAITQSFMNSVRLGHNYVGTEHLLLGLFDVPEGIGGKVLLEKGMTKAGVEADVVEILRKVS